jgi:hypothetical protein
MRARNRNNGGLKASEVVSEVGGGIYNSKQTHRCSSPGQQHMGVGEFLLASSAPEAQLAIVFFLRCHDDNDDNDDDGCSGYCSCTAAVVAAAAVAAAAAACAFGSDRGGDYYYKLYFII